MKIFLPGFALARDGGTRLVGSRCPSTETEGAPEEASSSSRGTMFFLYMSGEGLAWLSVV